VKKKKYSIKPILFFTVFFAVLIFLVLLFIHNEQKRIPPKKQIILISVDTLRGDHLSSFGYPRDTSPHLNRLIKDSNYYINAYPNGCWTMPSHMSLLTGTLPSRHGVNSYWGAPRTQYRALDNSITTLAENLKAHGIKTMKFALLPDELGFASGFEINKCYDPFFTHQVLENVLREIENYKDKNFFLFVHTWMVHAPYSSSHFLDSNKIPPEEFYYIDNFRKLSPAKDRLVEDFRAYLKKINLYNPVDCMALYDSGIYQVDIYIGEIIEKLKKLGIYNELMFIVVSDHGEHFAEHYPNAFYSFHGNEFYEEFVKIPIIIKYPYCYKPGKYAHPVSLIDIFPTIFDFYEFEVPGLVQGESLLKEASQRKEYVISEAISDKGKEKKMIRIGDFKYIVTMNDPTKPGRVNWDEITGRNLFNLKEDPKEQQDLYPHLKYRRKCLDFEKILNRNIKDSVLSHRQVRKTTISNKTRKQLKTLGYL